MKLIWFVFSLILSQQSFADNDWWVGSLQIGSDSQNCRPSAGVSMAEFTAALDADNKKYSFTPDTEEFGFYMITEKETLAVSIWTKTLEKCVAGSRDARIHMGMKLTNAKSKENSKKKQCRSGPT